MQYKVVHVDDVTQEMEQAATDANSLFGNWPAVIRAAIHDAPDTGMVAVRRDDLEKLLHVYNFDDECSQRVTEALSAGVK